MRRDHHNFFHDVLGPVFQNRLNDSESFYDGETFFDALKTLFERYMIKMSKIGRFFPDRDQEAVVLGSGVPELGTEKRF